MFEVKGLNLRWMLVVGAAIAFASATAQAVGVAEPEDTPPAERAVDGEGEDAHGPRERGRRGFGRGQRGLRDGVEDGPPGRRGRGGRGARDGRGGRGGGRRPGAMLWARMSDEEREEIRAFVAEHFPAVSEALEAHDSGEGMSQMDRKHARMLPEILRMHELSLNDPELFEIKLSEHKSRFLLRRLVREYRQADNDVDRGALREKIRPLMETAFDAKQKRMEQEVKRLEGRLEGLRDHIAKRADNRDEEIERAFNDVLEGRHPGRDQFKGKSRKQRGRGQRRQDPVAVPQPE